MATTIDLEKEIHRLKQLLVTGTPNSALVKQTIKKLEKEKSKLHFDEWLAR